MAGRNAKPSRGFLRFAHKPTPHLNKTYTYLDFLQRKLQIQVATARSLRREVVTLQKHFDGIGLAGKDFTRQTEMNLENLVEMRDMLAKNEKEVLRQTAGAREEIRGMVRTIGLACLATGVVVGTFMRM